MRSRPERDLRSGCGDHHIETGTIRAGQAASRRWALRRRCWSGELRRRHKILTPMQATLLLAGIYEDTGNLTFPSTRAEERPCRRLAHGTQGGPGHPEYLFEAGLQRKAQKRSFPDAAACQRSRVRHSISINTVTWRAMSTPGGDRAQCTGFLNVDAAFSYLPRSQKTAAWSSSQSDRRLGRRV